jgi:hypothetical protein
MPITMELEDVEMKLRINPETGLRPLAFHDPASQISIQVAMPEDSAKTLAAGLNGSSLIVAQPGSPLLGGPVI